jgi:thymidine phosphorylase
VNIYMICQNQLIMSPLGGAVDINHLAVHEAMRLYRIKDKQRCFEKVLTLANHILPMRREAATE